MRKYFLLSAVAMLMATNANADAVLGTFSATAQIERYNEITCTPLNFGTILYAANATDSVAITIDELNDIYINGDNVKQTGEHSRAECSVANLTMENSVTIIPNEEIFSLTDDLALQDITFAQSDGLLFIGGTLTIEPNVFSGTYTGTVGFTAIY
ncbi:MAG: DUF4402 domain-containing protein [Alphaproteobacteria bacterium]|nr:DUF4402 domain-containing protein [Alphaproteobacteria bacterium]